MYVLNRSPLFQDEIKLENGDGTSEVLKFEINMAPEMVKQYRQLQVRVAELTKQQKATDDQEVYAKIFQTGYEICTLLFGANNAKKLLDYYQNDFTAMAAEIFPYIHNVIAPALNQAVKERKKNYTRKFFR